jgi:nicotinamide-nucleotide amidase
MMPPDSITHELVAALAAAGSTVATAESLTGGMIGAAITAVPGASAVYRGGVITYATDLKASLGGVPDEILAAHGPVAPETAIAMALGVRVRTGADWAVAATGVAGPDPQDGHGPGEVWVGFAGPDGRAEAVGLRLPGDRSDVRAGTVTEALSGLLARITAASSRG